MTTEVVDNSILSRILANGDTSAFTPSTDGLQPIRDRGDSAWITATSVTVSDKTGFSLAADQSGVTIGTVTTNTDMVGTDNAALASVCTETRLAELDAANLPADIAGLNDVSTAQVNAEVLDVLNVDTFAELAAVPAATSTIVDKLNWLFALARNKITQTSTTQTLRNDADGGNIATSTVSDDATTYTRGEFT
jgi:hypothetical protein